MIAKPIEAIAGAEVFPKKLIGDWSTDSAKALRPLFDMVWNAFGYDRFFNYDESGRRSER